MSDVRPLSELLDSMDPAELEDIKAGYPAFLEEIALADLRHAMKLSQVTLAKAMNVNQSSIAKLEKRSDMLVSTLSNFVKAMGGEMYIGVRVAGREYRLKSFSDLIQEENNCHA